MLLRFISVLLLFTCSPVLATPFRIIVVSQAEESKTNTLTSAGQKYAASLVGYFLGIPPKVPPLFADMVSTSPNASPTRPITFIGTPSSLGAIQTIAPLANVIFFKKAPITTFTNMPESVKQFIPQKLEKLKSDLYENSTHSGKTAIICWKDSDIPRLLIELEPRLKSNGLFQSTFPSDNTHNQAFVITYKQDKPSFQVLEIH